MGVCGCGTGSGNLIGRPDHSLLAATAKCGSTHTWLSGAFKAWSIVRRFLGFSQPLPSPSFPCTLPPSVRKCLGCSPTPSRALSRLFPPLSSIIFSWQHHLFINIIPAADAVLVTFICPLSCRHKVNLFSSQEHLLSSTLAHDELHGKFVRKREFCYGWKVRE